MKRRSMTEEQALVATIHAYPREDTPRLVFADWLDEHDREGMALFIRWQIQSRIEVCYTLGTKELRFHSFRYRVSEDGLTESELELCKGIGKHATPMLRPFPRRARNGRPNVTFSRGMPRIRPHLHIADGGLSALDGHQKALVSNDYIRIDIAFLHVDRLDISIEDVSRHPLMQRVDNVFLNAKDEESELAALRKISTTGFIERLAEISVEARRSDYHEMLRESLPRCWTIRSVGKSLIASSER